MKLPTDCNYNDFNSASLFHRACYEVPLLIKLKWACKTDNLLSKDPMTINFSSYISLAISCRSGKWLYSVGWLIGIYFTEPTMWGNFDYSDHLFGLKDRQKSVTHFLILAICSPLTNFCFLTAESRRFLKTEQTLTTLIIFTARQSWVELIWGIFSHIGGNLLDTTGLQNGSLLKMLSMLDVCS